MLGTSSMTSPCMTTSLAPVCVSLMEDPDENFRPVCMQYHYDDDDTYSAISRCDDSQRDSPNTFAASLIFRSFTVSNPATTVTNFLFCLCTRLSTTFASSRAAFFSGAAPAPFFLRFDSSDIIYPTKHYCVAVINTSTQWIFNYTMSISNTD